jgi:hypothetical protein
MGAALVGAQPIIVADVVDSKLETAMEFGATHVVNARTQDILEAVHELTNCEGVDFLVRSHRQPQGDDAGLPGRPSWRRDDRSWRPLAAKWRSTPESWSILGRHSGAATTALPGRKRTCRASSSSARRANYPSTG